MGIYGVKVMFDNNGLDIHSPLSKNEAVFCVLLATTSLQRNLPNIVLHPHLNQFKANEEKTC